MGPKGTYLNTSIPGTGLYNRQKIGPAPGAKTTTKSSSEHAVYTPASASPKKPSENKGCLHTFMVLLCVFSGLLICGGIVTIIDSNKKLAAENAKVSDQINSLAVESDGSNETQAISVEDAIDSVTDTESESQIETIKRELRGYYIELCILIIIFSLCIMWLIMHSSSGSKRNAALKSGSKTSKAPDSVMQNIQILRERCSKEKDPLKAMILKNYLGHQIKEDAEERLSPLVQKWHRKVEKNPNPKNEEQLKLYQEQYESAMAEATPLIVDIEGALSEQEKSAYKEFCEAFQSFKNCNKTWVIVSSTRNTELKSSAYTTVDKRTAIFKTGCFPYLKTSFAVPTFPASSRGICFVYPTFVIAGNSIDSFDVYPLKKISLRYKPTRFIESDLRPTDTRQVDTTYKYINKNGEPDRRYSYNPALPVFLYGDITIYPFGERFQVSNNDAALKLSNAYQQLQDCEWAKNEDIIESDEPSEIKVDVHCVLDGDVNKDDIRKAAEFVVLNQKASASEIQRELKIGYAKSGRILDKLEILGIIGPQNGTTPREVIVQDPSELDAILKILDNQDSAFNGISEQYFNDLLEAAKKIHSFGDKLSKDRDFCAHVGEEISGTVNWNGQVLTEPKDKIPIYLWTDVIQCHVGLGHDLDLSTNEGLGILMYNTLMVDPNFRLEYQFLEIIRQNLTEVSESFTRSAVASMSGNEGVFLLEVCLKDYNKQLHNQYIVLLYRFASLIAKADKTVSSKEADWLNKIIALKEPEGDDDVIKSAEPMNKPKQNNSKSKPNSAAKELNELIGLASVKEEINTLSNYIKVQKMRVEKGMKVSPVSYHCVFTGNPGTGKTTVARIVSEIYKELGILSKGHLVETDRSGLVAEYVGQTAVKTNKIIDSALDGILFIDEAYSLVDGGNSDYGKEAISTLLKRMEDDRDRLVVILAGYTDDMKRFIESNPGLQSRFNRYIEFPDYSAEELYQIFESNAKKYEYELTDEAKGILKKALDKAVEKRDKNFGNGRFVRNLFEKVVENQANRLSQEAEVTSETLATIEGNDILSALQ